MYKTGDYLSQLVIYISLFFGRERQHCSLKTWDACILRNIQVNPSSLIFSDFLEIACWYWPDLEITYMLDITPSFNSQALGQVCHIYIYICIYIYVYMYL